jgi:hypothetical protein
MFCELLRDAPAILEHAGVLRRLAVKDQVWLGFADVYSAMALMIQGKWTEGEGYLREAISFHKAVGLASVLTWGKLYEAEFLAAQGHTHDALPVVADAIADTDELRHLRSRALLMRANLLAQKSAEHSTIETAYSEAVECARGHGAKYFELLTTTSFARWLKLQNCSSEARAMLSQIYNWFSEGFDIFALREARNLLNELAGT